jgi:hypothetical protein
VGGVSLLLVAIIAILGSIGALPGGNGQTDWVGVSVLILAIFAGVVAVIVAYGIVIAKTVDVKSGTPLILGLVGGDTIIGVAKVAKGSTDKTKRKK